MFKVTLAGLRAHLVRFVLTGSVVMLGVGFLAAALIYGDTAKAAFYDDLARGGLNVDTVVRPTDPDESNQDDAAAVPSDVSAADLATIRGVEGAASVEGRLIVPLALLGPDGRAVTESGEVGWGVNVPAAPGLAMYRVVDGHAPDGPDQAALDEPTARRLGLRTGTTITVLDGSRQAHRLNLVGLLDFGVTERFADTSVVALTDATLRVLAAPAGYAEVIVTARPGIDEGTLRDRVAAALNTAASAEESTSAGADRYTVETGSVLRERLAADSGKYVDGFLSVLLASTLVALSVSCLVIYNSLGILVAQRSRELALLRCVGASRRQLFGKILTESAVVGAVASVAGVACSVAIAEGLLVARGMFGAAAPDHALVITPRTVAITLVVGTAATVAAGLLPAIAAARVPPVEALATRERPDRGRPVVIARVAAGLALAAIGAYITRTGLGSGFDGIPRVTVGAMVVFVAIVVVAPLVVGHLVRALAWLPARHLGVSTRLATLNARRHPNRVATNTIALMIGIALMSIFTVLLSTARTQADRELAENFSADFVVHPVAVGPPRDGASASATMAGDIRTELQTRPEFATVGEAAVSDGFLDDHWRRIASLEPALLETVLRPEVMAGSLDRLRPGEMALRKVYADDEGVSVGDTVSVENDDKREADLRVVAIFDDAPFEGEALMEWSDFGQLFGGVAQDRVLVRRADGVSAATARSALDEALRAFPLVAVDSVAERRESLADALDRRLTMFGALFGVSTLIAILGIMNTLSLSVLERTRESAMLRALGLGARQLRRMLLVEGLLMAGVGALIGVAFGVAFGWIAAYGLITAYGHGSPDIPVVALAGYVALAAVAGVIASVLPARRAVSRSIVSAMAAD